MSLLKGLLILRQDLSTRFKFQRAYKREVDPYGYRISPYELTRFKEMQALLEDRTYERALEAGCAEGEFTRRLAPLCQKLVALDISPLALERAKKAVPAPHVEWAQANIRTWQPNVSFDLVVLADVLYYLGDPPVGSAFETSFDGLSRKVASWLQPYGRLLLAHCFANESDLAIREDYGRRFEREGLTVITRRVTGGDPHDKGELRCLLQLLEKPAS